MNSDVWLETETKLHRTFAAGRSSWKGAAWEHQLMALSKQRCPGAQAMRISLKDTWTTEDKGILHLPIESCQFNHISVPISSRNHCDTKVLSWHGELQMLQSAC